METLSAFLLADFGPSSAKKKFYFENVGRKMTTEKVAQANEVNSASLGITSLTQRCRETHNKFSVLLFYWLALWKSICILWFPGCSYSVHVYFSKDLFGRLLKLKVFAVIISLLFKKLRGAHLVLITRTFPSSCEGNDSLFLSLE